MALYSEYFEDKSRSLAFDDIIRTSPPFIANNHSSFKFGVKRSAFWIRFYVKTGGKLQLPRYIEFDNAALGIVEVYCPVVEAGLSKYISLKGGWLVERENGEVPFVNPALRLPLEIDDTKPLYVRILTPYLPTTGCYLRAPDDFRSSGMVRVMILGMAMGVLISMFLYNGTIFIFLRDRNYFIYLVYVFMMMMYQCSVTGTFRYINRAMGNFLISMIPEIVSVLLLVIILFVISFLNLKRYAPIHHKLMLGASVVCGAILLIAIFKQRFLANAALYYVVLAMDVLILTAGISSLKSGFVPAKYFLVAWIFLISGAVIFVLRGLGIIPQNPATHYAIFIGSSIEAIVLSFALGYRIKTIREESEELRRKEVELEFLSNTDGLTNLYNKRYLNTYLKEAISEKGATTHPFSILMMDIDHFKKFNDTHGHLEGDRLLVRFAQIVRSTIRGDDIPCRYGGEEFVVILNAAEIDDARIVAEKIRSRFEQNVFETKDGKKVISTVSIGIAAFKTNDTVETLLKRADDALYRAKVNGRNRCEVNY
ncbi:MAG: sensor domain-containing diguanylate cyclase [Spirochaetes bacterium]|nr:sensor domain-containing diguanylate cyclase [Spirochaetota bacterium]